jgi:hypothetical protein
MICEGEFSIKTYVWKLIESIKQKVDHGGQIVLLY